MHSCLQVGDMVNQVDHQGLYFSLVHVNMGKVEEYNGIPLTEPYLDSCCLEISIGVQTECRQSVDRQNVEQTKCRTDKMSTDKMPNRQNVDIYIYFFQFFFSSNFSMPKNNVAGNSGMPLSANLLKLESSILPRAKRASSETT